MQLPGGDARSCTRRRADVAFQEFQAALERGVEPLPSAALAEPEEPGGWGMGPEDGVFSPRRADQIVRLTWTVASMCCWPPPSHCPFAWPDMIMFYPRSRLL